MTLSERARYLVASLATREFESTYELVAFVERQLVIVDGAARGVRARRLRPPVEATAEVVRDWHDVPKL